MRADRHGGDQPAQVVPAPAGHLGHQLASRGGQRQADHPPVAGRPGAPDQALAHQPVAHPAARRRVHAELGGDVGAALRTAGGEHDERPELRQRHVGVEPGQGPGGQRHHRAARGDQPLHQFLLGRRRHGAIVARGFDL